MTANLPASSLSFRDSRPRAAVHQRPSGRSRPPRIDPSTITSPATRPSTQISPGARGTNGEPRPPRNHSPPALTEAPVQISGTRHGDWYAGGTGETLIRITRRPRTSRSDQFRRLASTVGPRRSPFAARYRFSSIARPRAALTVRFPFTRNPNCCHWAMTTASLGPPDPRAVRTEAPPTVPGSSWPGGGPANASVQRLVSAPCPKPGRTPGRAATVAAMPQRRLSLTRSAQIVPQAS